MSDLILNYYLVHDTPAGTRYAYPRARLTLASVRRPAYGADTGSVEVSDPDGAGHTLSGDWLITDQEVAELRSVRPGERVHPPKEHPMTAADPSTFNSTTATPGSRAYPVERARREAAALRWCARCPVVQRCADDADHHRDDGLRGGSLRHFNRNSRNLRGGPADRAGATDADRLAGPRPARPGVT